ncbi:MAG: HD domain-containing protein [Myxococcota bacterium]|jgi:(p)ppGpp synthase/HD superfamily hydrolase|nr:HD domain-containing protein [Myxococcota bacterium]
MPHTTTPQYSERLDAALALAADAFRMHVRKASGVPYLTHLLQVMVTVGEHGGDEDLMIAALLHDYLEDVETADAEALEARFGRRVRTIVEALSDTTEHPKPPWAERKTRYLAHLASEPPDVKLVSAADKLHNARSTLRDVERVGEETWSRFNATKEQSLWYYRSVVDALAQDWSHPLVDELRVVVEALHEIAGAGERIERATRGRKRRGSVRPS